MSKNNLYQKNVGKFDEYEIFIWRISFKNFFSELKMSRQLEIFHDASVYTLESSPANHMISVPIDLENVSTFIRSDSGIIPIQSQLVLSGLLDSNNLVNVIDKYGNNLNGNLVSINNEVVIVSEGRTVTIKKPVIIRTIASGKNYQIESGGNLVFLKGINSKVSWSPIYYLYMNNNEELTNMNLSGLIQNVGECFSVDRLILSLKTYYGKSIIPQPQSRPRERGVQESVPRMIAYSSAQVANHYTGVTAEETEEQSRTSDETKTYLINRLVNLTKEVNMPLWNRQVVIPRIYFFFIGDTKVYYGYEIQDIGNDFFPAGTVRVFNTDLTAVKEFTTPGSLKRKVRFIVDESQDIRITPNIRTNDQGVTDFNLTVNSSKQNSIILKIIQKVKDYKKIISQQKYTEDRNWGEVVWDTQINPGITQIEGAFTIVYS
jgi:hypothetical protein